MDIYLTALALGGVGLAGMAVGGFARHGSEHGSGTASHAGGHGGHGHAHDGHLFGSHSSHGPVSHGNGAHGHAVQGHTAHGHDSHGHSPSATTHSNPFLSLMSPRLLFSVALGLGTAGLLLRPFLSGPFLFAAALAAGIAFERAIVAPVWNFSFRFESTPATTLESSLMDVAIAVTAFDRNGQGLIAVDVDGQMVQLLGTLQKSDRDMRVKVPVGSRLRIEGVDAARNRCTVSLI